MKEIRVIDSHTAGEPTRLVLEGGPPLGSGSLDQRAARFRTEFDAWRSAIVNEPRGSDAMVGALLCAPHRADCRFGVIFFNNVGVLGMCGHGTIGLIASLAYRGELAPGRVRIDTPVGAVDAELFADGGVSLDNVPSYRAAEGVVLDVPGVGRVSGDVAWGGNWFFLVDDHGLVIDAGNIDRLTEASVAIRRALAREGITGADGAEIDHVELVGASPTPGVDARNFVLCPGLVYDRSPCGTGTCAKLACLAADGKLAPGAPWRQESVIGSEFQAHYRRGTGGAIVPVIRGRAHVVADARFLFDAADPFAWGIA